jgi:tetratricopeptide (TPR) repeat protein/O-antigen ligase
LPCFSFVINDKMYYMAVKDRIIKISDFIIEYGLLAIVFFIPIIFDYTVSSYNIVDLYKVVVFRLILSIILLVYITKIFLANRLSFKGSGKIFLLVLLWLGSFFTSSLFSLHPSQSFWGNFFRQQGFYNFFNYLLFFSLIILNIKSFKQIRRIIIAAVASASVTAVYGLIQYFSLDPWKWTENFIITNRVFSTIGQPNFFGHFLIMVFPLGLYALFFLAKSLLARFFVLLALVMQLFCLYFTYSRGAWLGFLGSWLSLLLFWLAYRRRKKLAIGLIGLLLVGGTLVISLSMIKPVGLDRSSSIVFMNRLKSMVNISGGSNRTRLNTIKAALQGLKDQSFLRSLVGYGPDVLADVFIRYYKQDWGIHEAINTFPDRAHNWLLDQLLSLGIFGLMVNLVFYFYLIYQAGKFIFKKSSLNPDDWLLIFLFVSLTAYCINNFFSFSLFTNLVYLYLILALAWLIINHQGIEKIIAVNLTIFSKIFIWLALIATLSIFIYTNNIIQIEAEIYYARAIESLGQSACGPAVENIEKVIFLSPNDRYYQEGYLYVNVNCFPSFDKKKQFELFGAMLSQIKSINDRLSYGLLVNIARSYSLFGAYINKIYYHDSEKIFNELIVDYPYVSIAYEDLARQKMQEEDYRGVIKVVERALTILPPPDHPDLNQPHREQVKSAAVRFYELIGQAYVKIKNYSLARKYYNQAIKFRPYRSTLFKSLADTYYLAGEYDQAVNVIKRGQRLNPTDYNWYLSLSLIYRDQKDLPAAKKYLLEAMKLSPDNEQLKQYYLELNKK